MPVEITEDQLFIDALETGDLPRLRQVAKSDLHNHSLFGGSPDHVEKLTGRKISPPEGRMQTVEEMVAWGQRQIFPGIYNRRGFIGLIRAALLTAAEDGVVKLEMSIDAGWIDFFYDQDIPKFASDLRHMTAEYGMDLDFRPELGLKWEADADLLALRIDEYLDTGLFESLDLYGHEKFQPVNRFIPVFRKAGDQGLKLKAHAGEFGDPPDVVEVVEKLGVSVVQHGIAAAGSEEVMNYLARNKICLNICPTSNLVLSRVRTLEEHPVRQLFDHGIGVTLNSDDLLVFNTCVSEEYLKLFRAGVFTASELNMIRKYGLEQ